MDHHHHPHPHQQHHQHPHQQHHHQQHHHQQHHSHHPQQHSHHQHHQQQPPPHPIYPTNSSPYQTPQMISTPNFSNPNKFPFTASISQPPAPPPQTTTSAATPAKPTESMGPPYSGSGSAGFDPNGQKKKRGRPRKYSPDTGGGVGGNGGAGTGIALGLSPTPISSVVVSPSAGGGQADSTGATPENASKKNRGRPAGSSKKQLDALGNCGVGFTPHVILVNAGEDIASKIRAFSQQGARTVCVLSANGSISNVDLRQPAMSTGVVNYEGRFEIISLSGSFVFSENSGIQGRSGGLSVSLAATDGRVLGGGVVGVLRAATPVQIIVGSFIADGKKPKYMPSVPQSHMLSFAATALPAADGSPPSQEVSTEGSDENGSNHFERNTGPYNSNPPMHHNMQMYSQMGWPNSTSKMLQN